jgi:hypothetical protein
MATSFTRLIHVMGFGAILTAGVAHAEENVLPDPLAQQLSALIQSSLDGSIDPGIFALASQNPAYSDEIACISVQFFGQPELIQEQILQGISDPQQQQAVSTAVQACSQKDVAGGYGAAIASFNQGLVGGDVNTLSNTQDTTSPIAP